MSSPRPTARSPPARVAGSGRMSLKRQRIADPGIKAEQSRETLGKGRNGADECPVCGRDLAALSILEREVHANECLDGRNTPATCPVCKRSFALLRVEARARHVESCLRATPRREQAVAETSAPSTRAPPLAPAPREDAQGGGEGRTAAPVSTTALPAAASGPRPFTPPVRHAAKRITTYFDSNAAEGSECIGAAELAEFSEAQAQRIGCHYFLTHFHSDHYGGLTSSFDEGFVYCTDITARCVHAVLGVRIPYLRIIDAGDAVAVAGVRVTAVDANHCPGAVMFIFTLGSGKRYLHCGDFRYTPRMMDHPELRLHFHTVFLDTTYCDPRYTFCTQSDAIEQALEFIEAQLRVEPKTLFLFGTYSIGKERVFLGAAKHFGWKVYADARKRRLLSLLGLEADGLVLTKDARATPLHVVPMSHLSRDRMAEYHAPLRSVFRAVRAIRPTGWTHSQRSVQRAKARMQQGVLGGNGSGVLAVRDGARALPHVLPLPYSEHSSFTELQACVKALSWDRLVPTVNCRSPEDAERLVSLLAGRAPPAAGLQKQGIGRYLSPSSAG